MTLIGLSSGSLDDMMTMHLRYPTDIWTSASAPTKDLFAVGTGGGIILLERPELPNDGSYSRPRTYKMSRYPLHRGDGSKPGSSHVLALGFMSDQGLLAGQRNGTVSVLDLRAEKRGRNVSISIQHGACVTHVRRVDDYRVVVNGLNSSVGPDPSPLSLCFGNRKRGLSPFFVYYVLKVNLHVFNR